MFSPICYREKKKIYFSILFLISARDITCSEISIPE